MYNNQRKCEKEQRHVHEFLGSTRLAEVCEEDVHNHRVACISGPAVGRENDHVHKIETRTDFFNDHFHHIEVCSGPPIKVCENRHIHFVYAVTSCNDGHRHKLILGTLIENPIGHQ